MTEFAKFLVMAGSALLLASCSTVSDWFDSDDDRRLEGERISVLALEETLEPDDAVLESQGLVMPTAWANQFWPQAGGYPNHAMQNLALPESALKQVWSVKIGKGSTKELPLTAQPVLVDGMIFTLDTAFELSAFNAETGKLVWQTNVMDKNEDDPVIAGGISYAGGLLYVTNGYDEILAVKPSTGEILWHKPLPTPSRAAPTIINGRIFVATLDSRLLALSAEDGALLWEYTGLSEVAGLVGAASPAANNDIVVPVFSSGEITALRVENGSVAWSDNISGVRKLGGLEALPDIKALPVLDKGLVLGVSFGGRLVAIDERTGTRLWQREIGSSNTPWIAGNHVFLLSTDNQLVAVGRDNGVIRWVSKIGNAQSKPLFFTGPVLAGGRLFIAGTHGIVIEANPETGEIIRQWDAGETISIPPIVANGTLYILGDDGRLSAYR
ncbi:MAG: PQQ-binding-like beta-propeller repeat protein [Alphaproteobacteria bacterium]|nr:PQQ-binding-like beta-propeller repeat protein [Alphaproteobacteria bacterium]